MLGMVGFNLDGLHRIKSGPSLMGKFCGNVLRHRLYPNDARSFHHVGLGTIVSFAAIYLI